MITGIVVFLCAFVMHKLIIATTVAIVEACVLVTSLFQSFALFVRAQVSECNWQLRRAPNLRSLYSVCKNMHLWLKQDQRNICVVHCLVSKSVL